MIRKTTKAEKFPFLIFSLLRHRGGRPCLEHAGVNGGKACTSVSGT